MTAAEQKASLRRQLRQQRAAVTDRENRDAAICRNVLTHPWMQEADLVLAYCSHGSEPDTYGLLRQLLQRGTPVALPVCEAAGQMRFCRIHSLAELIPDAYGIPAPAGRECPALTPAALCIVPGVAFTHDGIRLGQGGGYYDRFLQTHPALRTMGLCYAGLVQAELPQEAHDCRVKIVVTEEHGR